MRKIYVLSFLLLVLVTKSSGQISLVTSFDGNEVAIKKFTNIDGSIGFINQKDSNVLDIYNEDFSLNRTVTLNIPNMKEISNMDIYNGFDHKGIMGSTHLFNDNAALEFIVHLKNKTTGEIGFAVVDENSKILFSKSAEAWALEIIFGLMTTSNKIYLNVYSGNYQANRKSQEIYSLPGTERFDWSSSSSSTSDVKSVISKSNVYPFPNPAHSTVNLSYTLPKGSQGTLSVYDLGGKCLKTLKVDGTFPYVALDISGYETATYFYKVECNGTSVSSKFIVSR
jgi:hypothetical protein